MSRIDIPPSSEHVLVAIMNDRLDFEISQARHWYRIQITSAHRWVGKRWPPAWLAFYQTKVFGSEAYAVRYYSRVQHVHRKYRWQLFPDQPGDEKSKREYYRLVLSPLQQLPQPILSKRWRRIVFIPTTWDKFMHAVEINDLYDESPLEDRLWAEMKRLQIHAERQEFVRADQQDYALDFALYCALGKLDVETDGDTWHANPAKANEDNLRDNALKTAGWRILRFTTKQIRDEIDVYTLPTIVTNINRLGGLDEGKVIPRHIGFGDEPYQPGLFDEL
jgi:very-short-patch-repair endonuclease